MATDPRQELYEQLMSGSTAERIRIIRRLGATGDLEFTPDLVAIYKDASQPPAVRRAAQDTLGMFRAVQVAIQNDEQVMLPDPRTYREPAVAPETLWRLLRILAVVLVILVVVDVLLLAFLDRSGPEVPPSDPRLIAVQLQMRLDQLRADLDNQEQAWRQYQAIQTLGCDRFPAPAATSTSLRGLDSLAIDPAAYPDLYEASLKLGAAIGQFTLVSNNWVLGCGGGPVESAETNLALLEEVSAQLDEAGVALSRAHLALTPSPAPTPTVGELTPQFIPVTLPPTLEPTALLLDYGPYIRAMRNRIDAATVGRGTVAQLAQYWQDVRDRGQSFGCDQVLTADLIQNYFGVSAEHGRLDPRLLDIQVAINVGMTLARDSLANFQQGCATGNFSTLLELGQAQIQQAQAALSQASTLLDQLQAEVAGR